jgi:hypothetical protein
MWNWTDPKHPWHHLWLMFGGAAALEASELMRRATATTIGWWFRNGPTLYED